jgi:hypothetical protein
MELNVANNGIDEFGCFTLLAGLRENTSVSVPVLCVCVHAAGYERRCLVMLVSYDAVCVISSHFTPKLQCKFVVCLLLFILVSVVSV